MPTVPILSQLKLVHNPTSKCLKINLNIIPQTTLGSPKFSLSLRFPLQIPVYASPLPHTRYMPRRTHSQIHTHTHTHTHNNISSVFYIKEATLFKLILQYSKCFGSYVSLSCPSLVYMLDIVFQFHTRVCTHVVLASFVITTFSSSQPTLLQRFSS
jgi:hypothetical protein